MNWDDYTLYSFGDSFTFGQGLVAEKFINSGFSEFDDYAAETHKLAYTNKLKNKLGFKAAYNFGIPAGSNQRTYQELLRFVYNTPSVSADNSFVLIALTYPLTRTMVGHQYDDNHYYADFTQTAFLQGFHQLSKIGDNRISLSKNDSFTISEILFDKLAMLYTYVQTVMSIKVLLESRGLKYYMFDLMNDFGEHDYIEKYKNHSLPSNSYHKYQHDRDTLLNTFSDMLQRGDFKYYDCFKYTLPDKPGIYNYLYYMFDYALQSGDDFVSKYTVPDGHWNELGHELAANIICERMNLYDYS
mgnify:CR=1 FL=1|jgi:hypothetical protein